MLNTPYSILIIIAKLMAVGGSRQYYLPATLSIIMIPLQYTYCTISIRAGRSPTFQDIGTPLFGLGLGGTHGFASPGSQLKVTGYIYIYMY